MSDTNLKAEVRDFWNDESCGEIYATGESHRSYYDSHSKTRYELEPYLLDFAAFHEARGKDVLEVGVGMGADHIKLAESQPRSISGIDLTPRAIEHTTKRLATYGLRSDVRVADAENLPFADQSFDLVYSWGVLHHSPDTSRAISEVLRVLRPGGSARIMIYHKYSLTGAMLWLRYALLKGRPSRSLTEIYAEHLESPGTKAYSIKEASDMFSGFSHVAIKTQLAFGDLLLGAAGQRHKGALLSVAKAIWPRWLLRRVFSGYGLYLLVVATK